MVTYSRIPYHLAYRAGKIQREILDELCAGIADESAVDLGVADRLIADRLEPFLQEHAISLDY